MKRFFSIFSTLALLVSVSMQAIAEGRHPTTVIITAGQSNTDGRMTNDSLPQYIKEPYKRFLENKMRDNWELTGTPINLFVRQK